MEVSLDLLVCKEFRLGLLRLLPALKSLKTVGSEERLASTSLWQTLGPHLMSLGDPFVIL